MKKGIALLAVLFVAVSINGYGELIVRGTDSLGYQLIYDTDLNITWYDYTNYTSSANWQDQMNWASALTVNFEGNVYGNWRLPTTSLNGPSVGGYDGTGNIGYNITSNSEMSQLFYVALGNNGYFDTSGNSQSGWGLTNEGPFINLQPAIYWFKTEIAIYPSGARTFDFYYGLQDSYDKKSTGLRALAVLDGDVTVVPEPISSTLFLIGAGVLAGRKCMRRMG